MSSEKYVNAKVLRVNVGFILAQPVGFTRELAIEVPSLLRVAEDLMLGHFYATLQLSQAHGGVLVQGTVETSVFTQCSRCVDDIWLPVEFSVQEVFDTNDSLNTEYKVDDNNVIDLAPLIREEALLHVPMTTPVDQSKRCLFCERTFDDVLRDMGIDAEIDPRLEILKSLRNQLDNSQD